MAAFHRSSQKCKFRVTYWHIFVDLKWNLVLTSWWHFTGRTKNCTLSYKLALICGFGLKIRLYLGGGNLQNGTWQNGKMALSCGSAVKIRVYLRRDFSSVRTKMYILSCKLTIFRGTGVKFGL